MVKSGKVLLITGPSGSGKTSLAKRVAKNKDWTFISEDSVWGKLFPNHASRTEEMRKKVIEESIKQILSKKSSVVFEFLVYTRPPKIIRTYTHSLKSKGMDFKLVVLKPSFQSILDRKNIRLRKDDHDDELNKKNISHQLSCLDSKIVPKKSIISDSISSTEEVYQKYLKNFVE